MIPQILTILRLLKRVKTPRLFRPKRFGIPSLPKGKVSTWVKRGITQRMAREVKQLGHGFRVLGQLVAREGPIDRKYVVEMEQRAHDYLRAGEMFAEVGVQIARQQVPKVPFDSGQNYISEQGGRVSIGVEFDIFDPNTNVHKEAFHTFIFDDLPGAEEWREALDNFVNQLIYYPEFEDIAAGGSHEYDFEIVGIEEVE